MEDYTVAILIKQSRPYMLNFGYNYLLIKNNYSQIQSFVNQCIYAAGTTLQPNKNSSEIS